MSSQEFNQFADELSIILAQGLPGAEAHERLAPPHRRDFLRMGKNRAEARMSSVLILLHTDDKNGINVVFTKRREYEGVHSGQVSFPGGKWEPEDETLMQTAIRETVEEIGIHQSDIHIIGEISDLFVPPSNFVIRPFIARLKNPAVFIPDPIEVEAVFSVPLLHFMEKGADKLHLIQLKDGSSIEVPGYLFNGYLIWGATAMILHEFISVAALTPSYLKVNQHIKE